MSIFNHVQIKVKNLKVSRKFYDCVMKTLGYSVVLDVNNCVIGYGLNVHDMFEIRQLDNKSPLSKSVHIAFNAACKEDVDAFYKKALEMGGQCNGQPGFRSQSAKGYYAAFVMDPDGHNIEAVFMEKY